MQYLSLFHLSIPIQIERKLIGLFYQLFKSFFIVPKTILLSIIYFINEYNYSNYPYFEVLGLTISKYYCKNIFFFKYNIWKEKSHFRLDNIRLFFLMYHFAEILKESENLIKSWNTVFKIGNFYNFTITKYDYFYT